MKYVGYATVTILLMVFSALFNGYALSVLWGWFIVPTFNSPQLSIPAAIGVSMIVGYLAKTIKVDDEDKQKPFGETLFKGAVLSVLKPTIALMFGWVVSVWM